MQCVSILDFYKGYAGTGLNSGFDLYVPEDTIIPAGQTVFIDHKIKAMTTSGHGYWLLPRSSISKTPLRMANSVGLIDPTYRGNIIAALTNTSNSDFLALKGTRLVQLAIDTLEPFKVTWVDSLPETIRGDGGFGSTGI